MTPIEWMLSGDTGISSETICAVMTGSKKSGPFGTDVPHDPGDFGRCYRLLQHFPEWRARLREVAEQHPAWGPMVDNWEELTALYEQELANNDGRMPELFARLRELVDEGRRIDGWVEKAPGWWER